MATQIFSGYMALGSALSSNNTLTELSGNGYTRQAVTLTFDSAGKVLSISGATFGPDITAAWSAVTYVAIFDASTNGNLIATFPIPSTTLAVGQSYTVPSSYVSLNANAAALFVASSTIPPGTVLGTLTDLLATNLSGVNLTTGPVALALSAALALTATSVTTTLTYAATLTPSVAAGNTFAVTLTGNLTLNAPVNAIPGQTYRFFLTQDGTGSRTLTLGTGFKTAGGAPTLTTTAGATDLLDLFYDGTTFWSRVFKAFA